MFLSIHDEHMFQPLKGFASPMAHRLFTYLFDKSKFLSTAILDNEILLGILFNGTMEINISVIALFVFNQSTKNLR